MRTINLRVIAVSGAWIGALVLSGPVAKAAETATAAPAGTPAAAHTVREAGARFGQALGAAIVCSHMAVTAKAKALAATYSGDDRRAFDAEAEKVSRLWRELETCRSAGGPNECKVSKDMSCGDAGREIGPNGSDFPDLVEFAP